MLTTFGHQLEDFSSQQSKDDMLQNAARFTAANEKLEQMLSLMALANEG